MCVQTEIRMSDECLSDTGREYLLGVIEGFYGKPWSIDERQTLFKRMSEQSMNTYIYAPKGTRMAFDVSHII